ncbi:hypothetical protein DFQ30_003899, partial [Apophysomyces sp. BC1015]
MLNWDDESTAVTPPSVPQPTLHETTAAAAVASSAGYAVQAAGTPTPLAQDIFAHDIAVAPGQQPIASPAPASEARVNVADKRIINGRTDVNQLVPFKYKWA